MEMLRALRSVLPHDPPDAIPEDPADRNEVHIDRVDLEYFGDLSKWFTDVKDQWEKTHPRDGVVLDEPEPEETAAAGDEAAEEDAAATEGDTTTEGTAPAETTPAASATAGGDATGEPGDLIDDAGPSGPGWVIEIVGHHYHNESRHKPNQSAQFVRDTLIKNLLGEGPQVTVDVGPRAGETVSVKEFGIGYPVLVSTSTIQPEQVVNPLLAADGGLSTGVGMMGESGMMGMEDGMGSGGFGRPGMGSSRRPPGAGS